MRAAVLRGSPERDQKGTTVKPGKVPFVDKLRPELQPEVAPDRKGRGLMLLPTPMLVAEAIAAVPAGEVITGTELRDLLAQRYDANLTCPLMTGIFLGLVAGAAEEQIAAGHDPVAPYWRVVRDDGAMNEKAPYGPERQAEHLRREGHAVHLHGNRLKLDEFASRSRA